MVIERGGVVWFSTQGVFPMGEMGVVGEGEGDAGWSSDEVGEALPGVRGPPSHAPYASYGW